MSNPLVTMLRQTAASESFRYCVERRDLRAAADVIERLEEQLTQLRGGIADLQRHVTVAVGEDCTRIPPGVLAVIGSLAKAAEAAKEDES